jgi:hypothetical protein
MVLVMTRRRGWTRWLVAKDALVSMRWWPKAVKTMLKKISRETIELETTHIRWFSRRPSREAGPGDRWPMTLKGKLISSFSQPGGLLK